MRYSVLSLVVVFVRRLSSGVCAIRVSCGPLLFFFLMIRRPPRSTLDRSSAASDVYKRQDVDIVGSSRAMQRQEVAACEKLGVRPLELRIGSDLSLIHISEPTRPY